MKNQVCIFLFLIVPITLFTQTISYDFEDNNLVNWMQSSENRWEISTTSPIGGLRSLKHAPTSGADKDRISINLPAWDASNGNIIWRFRVRHRANPSGSNNWGVFLSCDKEATGMISGAGANGYVVGVNLTGTDDILRLYRITNGTFTSILTSSVNWETQIGSTLTSIGAIEVERKKDGTFILKLATNGSFLSLQNQGSVVDNTFSYGGYFGVYMNYTTTAAGTLMVDDVSFTYKPVNPNDRLTQVVEPNVQITEGIISSLATTPELAVNIFRFKMHEQGSLDRMPTQPTKLRFTKVNSTSSCNWIDVIQGVRLKGNIAFVPITAAYIMSDAIEIEVDKASMLVADNSSREFTLSIYLKTSGVVDGQTIRMKVDDQNHGWETDFSGSDFAESFPSAVISNPFTIRVVPTHLKFQSIPNPVVVNKPFGVIANATDVVGNIALTYSGNSVMLSKAQGEGQIFPEELLESVASNGIITWSNVSYSKRDQLRLQATAQDLQPATSQLIDVINEPTSVILLSKSKVEGKSILSTQNTIGQSVEVFRFAIADEGAYDLEPTIVKQIFIKRPAGSNLASYSSNIAGVQLKANGNTISIGNPNILTSSISIPIPVGSLVIPDGDTVQVSMSIFLKSSGLTDGASLQFMVDAQGHSCNADDTGSTFASTFPNQVISSSFPIDVIATRLVFSSIPQTVGRNDPFTVEVSAVDEGGSLDVSASGPVSLSKNYGDGWLNIPSPSASFAAGKAVWTGLTYSYFTPQPFNILASSTVLNDVISSLVYCADRNTSIQNPELPLLGGSITSLAVGPNQAVEVLRFVVSDLGTTDDLPTFITQMVFRSMEQPTDVPLSRAIGGVTVWLDNQIVDIASTSITSNTITLSFGQNGLRIADKSSTNFSLGVYLKKGGQVDGSTIALYVPPVGHGWQTSLLGSGFPATFEGGLVGPTFTVDVVGTALSFVDQPFTATTETPIGFSIAAIDSFGNIDFNANWDVTIDLDYSPGNFTVSSFSKTLVSGVVNWNDISLQSIGGYRFKANSSITEIAQGNSQTIWCGNAAACHINENFEGLFLSFPLSSQWEVSTVSPIEGGKSLKHSSSSIEGESRLSIPLQINNLGDSPMEWSFVARNGSWDPTGDNTFWFVLASDSNSIKLGDFNGYAVGVNLTGTSDLLTLWRITRGQSPQVMVQSDFDWNENETVLIKITRTSKGEWSMWYQPIFGKSETRYAGQIVDTKHTRVVSCGLSFKYTSTRAGELWLDNLRVCTVDYPPVIQSARLLNLTSIDIKFSGAVNQNDAAKKSNYVLKSIAGQNFTILEAYPNISDASRVTLRTQQLPLATMMLKVDGISSSKSASLVRDSITIGFGTAGTFGSVIINEIMARPSPVVGLPNVEYIELFNRSTSAVSIKGWRLRGNNSIITLPDTKIEPNSYLIVSGVNGASSMAQFGNAIGVTSFPTLLVGGMFLGVYDANGILISWVEYSDSWYKSDIKKIGGYSLERIDSNNLVQGIENWRGSNDSSGGTPGRLNSVNAVNLDVSSPKVIELKVLSPNKIEIGFSEPMDSLSITLVSAYTLAKGIGSPSWASAAGPKYDRVTLTFASSMSVGEVYDICFNPSISDFSGNAIETNCLSIAVPQEPMANEIVINEVLFNPYTGGVDFVEIYNRSNKTFDLGKMNIASLSQTTQERNESYVASDRSWLLLPNSYAVLSENPALVEQFYTVHNSEALVTTRRMPSYSNDSGCVLLLSEVGDIIDEFGYTSKMHNPLLADVKGVSLERINPDRPTHDPTNSNWQSAAQTAGFATPTSRNSQFAEPTKVDDAFTLSSQIFSPNNDGLDDFVMIGYELPEPGYIANITVYDSKGRLVRRLSSNITLGTEGNIKWDGTTDLGLVATIGAYIVFIEAFDLKGNIKRYKKTVVVASRK
jgi:hypothetical protein